MAARVVKADPFCLDMPIKVETAARAQSPQQPASVSRVRMGSALAAGMPGAPTGMPGSPRVGRLYSGSPRTSPCSSPLNERLRLRTGSSLGMPINPYLQWGGGGGGGAGPGGGDIPLTEPIKEDLCLNDLLAADPRQRFRTASSLGMPISPWMYNGGLGAQQVQPDSLERCWEGSPCAPGLASAQGPLAATEGASAGAPAYSAGAAAYSAGEAWTVGEQPQQQQAPGSFPTAAPLPEELCQVQKSTILEERSATSPSETTRTTVMLRDLPEGLTRGNLLQLLDSQGFSGRYDFAYLPVNFDTMSSLTHAFVNLITAEDAARVREHFEGFTNWNVPSCQSSCHVVWNDKHQGLAALVERYRNSPVMHESVPDECKPAMIIDGGRVQFPLPTQRIKPPKNFRPKA